MARQPRGLLCLPGYFDAAAGKHCPTGARSKKRLVIAFAWPLLATLLIPFLCIPETAVSQDISKVSRELTDIEGEVQQLSKAPLQTSQLRGPTFVEERLTDGELFFRLKDYVRASILFTDIVDRYPNHVAYPEALFYLGESLFYAGDYFGARSRYVKILERSDQSGFRNYLQNALARLIEIAIRTRDFSGVEGYFERLSRLPTGDIAAATSYFRAKYLYSIAVPEEEGSDASAKPAAVDQQKLEQARAVFETVPTKSPYYLQARYFVGVIYALRAQIAQSIGEFQRVAKSKATTAEQRKVLELAQLALGRLYYESAKLPQAIDAYETVQRTAPDFDVALYELAWTHIYRGDATRAERALEVLGIAAPDSRYIPDGKVLRGNLLLRDGNYTQADGVFEEITKQFEPVRQQIEQVIAEHPDRAEYFRTLVAQNMEAFDIASLMPSLSLKWTNFQGDMQHAVGVLSDLSQARQLVSETGNVVTRMSAALDMPNPVNIFGDLKAHQERTTVFRNRLTKLRKTLIAAEEKEAASSDNPELATVRKQRHEIEALLGGMPTAMDDFRVRNDDALKGVKKLDSDLSEVDVQLMGIDARITAADRFISDTLKGRRSEGTLAPITAELVAQREAVKEYRSTIEKIRVDLEATRLRVGVGDASYLHDDSLRNEYNQLVNRERQLMGSGRSQKAAEIDNAFGRLTRIEASLDQQDARVKKMVEERTGEMRGLLEEERAKLAGYQKQLADLATETEIVVGWVTWQNFGRVQKRFYDLVLKADVGRMDVSWAEREEHRMRVEILTRERTRQIEALDQEFKEIVDQQGEAGGQM
jgi:tetratricopeptide (TPR) repeat protein